MDKTWFWSVIILLAVLSTLFIVSLLPVWMTSP